jgi:hypothetical protein
MPRTLLANAQRHAAALGLNLFGLVDAERFDRCQPRDQRVRERWPHCGTVLVVGSGGQEFWRQFAQACGGRAAGGPPSPTAPQQFASRCIQEIATCFRAKPLPFEVVEPSGPCPSLLRLGEAAGLGTVSPVSGLLLHPEFGPWVTLRAALLFAGHPFGPVPDATLVERFQPCCGCRQPCTTGCSTTPGNCPPNCHGRCACPIGNEHRSPVVEDAPPRQVSARWRAFAWSLWLFPRG